MEIEKNISFSQVQHISLFCQFPVPRCAKFLGAVFRLGEMLSSLLGPLVAAAVLLASVIGSSEADGWMSLRTQASLYTDMSILAVRPSSIHGHGTFPAASVPKGADLGLAWFDFFFTQQECDDPSNGFLKSKRGYIPDGGGIKFSKMTIADARAECSAWSECSGITFRDSASTSEGETLAPVCVVASKDELGSCLPDVAVDIEFKDKSTVIEDPTWQSFVKPGRSMTFHPLGCNNPLYPATGEDRLAHIPPEFSLVCWSRWINHACNATARVIFHDLPPGDTIPALPWGHCARSVRVVSLEALGPYDEITLNYEILPSYMQRSVHGVAACNASVPEKQKQIDSD